MHSLPLFSCLIVLFTLNIGTTFGDGLQIVAFGTSFTNGKGVFRSDAWPAKLEANLKAEGLSVHVNNEGVDGDTTRDLKRRLAKAVPAGTSIVILEYAVGNDNRALIGIQETVRNVDDIVSQLVSRKIQVLLVMRASSSEGLALRAKQFKHTISKFGISSIGIEQPDSSLQYDGKHPTSKAHTQIAASMVAPVKALIAKVRKE